MSNSEQYPYISFDSTLGEAGFCPYLPINLTYQQQSVSAIGLLDTGVTVNVMPYELGLELGYIWENQTTALNLTGNLAQFEARAVILESSVGKFEPVQLVLAWTKAEKVPLILGQVNFFMEFDVCFYCSQLVFEVCPKSLNVSQT
jgi:hypothetical protein